MKILTACQFGLEFIFSTFERKMHYYTDKKNYYIIFHTTCQYTHILLGIKTNLSR